MLVSLRVFNPLVLAKKGFAAITVRSSLSVSYSEGASGTHVRELKNGAAIIPVPRVTRSMAKYIQRVSGSGGIGAKTLMKFGAEGATKKVYDV